MDTRNLVLKTRGTLHVKVGDRYYEIDFRNLGVKSEEMQMPSNTIKNNCCQTYIETLDDGTDRVARKYQNYDFIEIADIPEKLSIKSGVIIKSSVDASIPIFCENYYSNFDFKNGGLYILYKNNGSRIHRRGTQYRV